MYVVKINKILLCMYDVINGLLSSFLFKIQDKLHYKNMHKSKYNNNTDLVFELKKRICKQLVQPLLL